MNVHACGLQLVPSMKEHGVLVAAGLIKIADVGSSVEQNRSMVIA